MARLETSDFFLSSPRCRSYPPPAIRTMGLRLFNTLSRMVEEFVPRDSAGRRVGMYCCGPTVYDDAHLGNFRTFVFADLVRRYLEFRGFEVFQVMNVTDVEDKIIARVQAAGTSLREFTVPVEARFLEDSAVLGCLRPHASPRATAHIGEMIELIGRLITRGLAYQAADGSVYFSIEKYVACGHRYGQLVHLNLEALRPGGRVRSDDYAKEAVADFALWKARVPEDGLVCWPSPWGEGRPGWHLECSAMSMKLLGPSFDLHLGGEDLIFPHHEDEIAQSEGAGMQATGDRFVRHWVHAAHLLVEGRKMSKSLGNYYTVRDLLARGATGREIRYQLLQAHYRETFNFRLENLDGARQSLARLDECLIKLREIASGRRADPDPTWLAQFSVAMDNDLNVSAAWQTVFDGVRELNRQMATATLEPEAAASALAAWERINSVVGVGPIEEAEAPPEIQALLDERQTARGRKDFAQADALRAELKARGWRIDDTPKGPRLKKE